MKRSHFAVVLTVACLAGFLAGFSISPFTVHAQTSPAPVYGGFSIGPIAPTVAQCPAAVAVGATYCPVGTGTSFSTYVNYNNLGWNPLVAPPAPTGVTSFNGRSGTITLTKGDVISVGLSASTTATTTLQ